MTTWYHDDDHLYAAERGIKLQPIMRQVYLWMGLGTLFSSGAAYLTINSGLARLAANPLDVLAVLIAEFGLVLGLSVCIQRLSTGLATALFLAYAALNGFTLSLVLLAVSRGTVETTFLATAGLFAAMAVFAMTTRIDLNGMGTYMIMGVIGLVIAVLVNLFSNSGPLDMLISMLGVLIFTGLTAFDTRRIGQMAAQMRAKGEASGKPGIVGALRLYLDFVNSVVYLLRFVAGSHHRQV